MDIDSIIGLFAVVMSLSIPIYALRRHYNQTDDRNKLRQLDKEHEIELIKQENYLLENKQMQMELDKIKAEREERTAELEKKDRWLIEDKKSQQ
ncbi:hypothetical protein [Corticicoccus populi]|uniref:Phage shock protein B n=1 Tax=Corticicoccus populi TaxID=1812821 RepID=A0ABW5WW81_9STAP